MDGSEEGGSGDEDADAGHFREEPFDGAKGVVVRDDGDHYDDCVYGLGFYAGAFEDYSSGLESAEAV